MTSATVAATGDHYAIGLDVGTSAVKGAVLTNDGDAFSCASNGYSTMAPHPGQAEQDPDQWWRAVGEVLDEILEAHPGMDATNTRIGLTGQMHTSVIRGEGGALLRPAILWSDTRAHDMARELAAERSDWVRITGNAPIAAFTSAHLAWLSAEEPQTLAHARTITVPKDDIRRRFGAGWATEPSDASAMNLMDTRTDRWARPLVELVGIREGLLPPIVSSSQVTGRVIALPPLRVDGSRLIGTPVVAGAADQAAQALALGARAEGDIAVSVGTSGAALQAIGEARNGAFRHAVPRMWLALDSTHAAGLALAWWAQVSQRPLGDGGDAVRGSDWPLFLPYLQGARDGHGAPGTLTDLRSTHDADDIAHAVVEGVGIELVRLVHSATLGHIPAAAIGVGGRAAEIHQLRAVMAAGLDRPIRYSGFGPAHGAAMIAASSMEAFLDPLAAADAGIVTEPDPALAAALAPRMARYLQLIERLS